jgi:hypothetical protein
MAYISFQPNDHFNTKLFTGNGSTQSITGVGFQPDWVWIKNREHANHNVVFDAVRGASKIMYPNLDNVEATASGVTAFDSDGFTLGNDSDTNRNSNSHASWNWKAGGAGSANTDGSINTTATSANTIAGFSISTYTGTGSNATVGHGLGKVPEMVVVKQRTGTQWWFTYHIAMGNTKHLALNSNADVSGASDDYWNNTTPTSSVFSIGTDSGSNASGVDFIAYAFAPIKGFSKFGKYKGTGNANGAFIYTGFKPAYVMARFIGSGNGYDFIIYDKNRPNPSNPAMNILEINTSDVENTGTAFHCDFLSNGFKFRGTESNVNDTNAEYLYMAFAEEPLVASNGTPATAR